MMVIVIAETAVAPKGLIMVTVITKAALTKVLNILLLLLNRLLFRNLYHWIKSIFPCDIINSKKTKNECFHKCF